MPIEHLLALYGYDDDGGAVVYGSSSPNGSEALTQENAVTGASVQAELAIKTVGSSGLARDNSQEEMGEGKTRSHLRKMLQSHGRIRGDVSHFSDSSSEDEDYVPLEDWKKVSTALIVSVSLRPVYTVLCPTQRCVIAL